MIVTTEHQVSEEVKCGGWVILLAFPGCTWSEPAPGVTPSSPRVTVCLGGGSTAPAVLNTGNRRARRGSIWAIDNSKPKERMPVIVNRMKSSCPCISGSPLPRSVARGDSGYKDCIRSFGGAGLQGSTRVILSGIGAHEEELFRVEVRVKVGKVKSPRTGIWP